MSNIIKSGQRFKYPYLKNYHWKICKPEFEEPYLSHKEIEYSISGGPSYHEVVWKTKVGTRSHSNHYAVFTREELLIPESLSDGVWQISLVEYKIAKTYLGNPEYEECKEINFEQQVCFAICDGVLWNFHIDDVFSNSVKFKNLEMID